MKDEKYYIIVNSDGETTVEELSEKTLLERLNEDYYGRGFIDKIPNNNDTNYWGEEMLIIKGQIAVPKSKEVVIEYTVC